MLKIFTKGNETQRLRAYAYKSGAFESKQTAFDHFLVVEGKEIEEAERLANIIAQARNVPDTVAPPPSGIDKVKNLISEGTKLANENPRVTELVVGVVSGLISALGGVVVGSSVSKESEQPKEEIKIDETADVVEII